LSVLVLARMAGLLNTVQVQAVQLAALARSDGLTGAPNRRTWDHELSRACLASREQATPLSVAVLDMDRFKAFNDQHGHQAGDRLLREAVAAWTEALGGEGVLARYGGEEFAVLMPGLGAEEALAVIQRLRAATPQRQTFSAGVAAWDPQTEPGSVVACADQALYQAKRTGRDRIVVHGSLGRAASEFADLPAITMVVQPIVEISTRRVVGHEALARFSGPDRDVQRVFQRAHRDGYGDLLELSAVRAALELPDRPGGHDLYVNVTAAALASERFWAGLPIRLDGIVIELGEDQETLDVAVLAAHVRRLRARGARIALDDVGAGAGEFSRLSALRPDVVKVDRSVVDGCAADAGRSAVLRALATYAQHLGATVCAEGVEEEADLEHLAAVGIARAQGYLFARPGREWQVIIGSAARFTELLGA
ncbi:MAG TPA: bifunctional diguanylate cyclase/phosphodiesterase, partial [Streptosporangiaceae bacterium]|nr:bifunctional diguanylate cyclase/phosphodiesterase [Streptosporangiaceae bacterium]